MFEVQGKYNSAKIFTDIVEQSAISQVIELCNQSFAAGSKIRMMPDIQAGAGCTVGTTMTIKDRVCPNIVGCDIGCGMEVGELLGYKCPSIGFQCSTGTLAALNFPT